MKKDVRGIQGMGEANVKKCVCQTSEEWNWDADICSSGSCMFDFRSEVSYRRSGKVKGESHQAVNVYRSSSPKDRREREDRPVMKEGDVTHRRLRGYKTWGRMSHRRVRINRG